MNCRALLPALLLLLANTAQAASNDTAPPRRLPALLPHFAQLQFAGNLGLLSIGLGYDFARDRLHLAVLDGYLPRSISKTRGINTISFRLSGDVARLWPRHRVEARPYAGVGALFETTGAGFYTHLPARYRDRRYYRNSAVHALCFAGVRAVFKTPHADLVRSIGLYGETGTLDSYLFYSLRNGGRHLTHIFSAALGVVVGIGR